MAPVQLQAFSVNLQTCRPLHNVGYIPYKIVDSYPTTFDKCRVRKTDWRRTLQTSNGRLPLEDGSDWHETLPKRVSDDSRHFILRR